MEKEKIEITGYVCKDVPLSDHVYIDVDAGTGEILIEGIWKRKGRASDWSREAWPPRRVRITIEG